MLIEFGLWGSHFFWFLLPDLALTALLILGARWGLEQAGRAAGSVLLPSGKGTPTARQYSEQEALIVRGQYTEAADSYRAIIADDPTNIEARLRLGRLLEDECKDPIVAEESYRRIRRLTPSREQDWQVANALIDLYHQSGQPDKLKAELARMSRQYQNTATGTNAQRRLDEIRSLEPTPIPPPVPPE